MKYRNATILAVVSASGIAALFGGASASGSGEPTPTTIVADAGYLRADEAADTPFARAVADALGDGSRVRGVTRTSGKNTDYTDIDATSAGTGYTVTVYARFDPGELRNLERVESKSGTAWIGSEDPDLASIYFLPDGDRPVGVWVGFQTRDPDRRVPTLDNLVQVAERIASDPVVIEEVQA